MMFGMKHSLCLISIESKTQPSESIPTKNGCRGLKERSFSLGDDCMRVKPPGIHRAGLADGRQQAAANAPRHLSRNSESSELGRDYAGLHLVHGRSYTENVEHIQWAKAHFFVGVRRLQVSGGGLRRGR